MEQMKNAINALEAAVLRLETAVHAAKKEKVQGVEQIDELKTVIRTAYERLDKTLLEYRKRT